MARLIINVDQVAALRSVRGGKSPDPVHAGVLAELAGVDGVTMHLRADQPSTQKRDLYLLREVLHTHLNLMIAPSEEMVESALKIAPGMVTLVKEISRENPTCRTLDLEADHDQLLEIIPRLQTQDILVALYVAPEIDTVKRAAKLKADYIELSALAYSGAKSGAEETNELGKLSSMASLASKLLLGVSCGGGLDYRNIRPLVQIEQFEEFILGQAIVSRALFVGLDQAIREILALMK